MSLIDTPSSFSNLLFFTLTFFLVCFFYYPTGEININHFHNDDYLLINSLANIDSVGNLMHFLFSTEVYKLRPVANLLYFFEFRLFSFSYNYYLLFNFFLFAVLLTLFSKFFFQDLNLLIKILIASIAVTSKFFVYHFWNITGSFEILSLIIFVVILDLIFRPQQNQQSSRILLFLFSITLIFTNERYLPLILFIPFAQSAILEKNFFSGFKKIRPWIVSLSLFGFYISMRLFLGVPIFVGTQTSNIVEDFNLAIFLYHLICSFFEVFGFSTLPTHLSGYKDFFNMPFYQWKNSYFYLHFIFAILFVFNLYVTIFYRKRIASYLVFLFLILISASVTFRLEMRWLTPAFVLILIFYSFAFRDLFKQKKHSNLFDNSGVMNSCLIYCFLFLFLLNNIYYIKHYRDSLYFGGYFNNQTIINKKYKEL